MNELNLRFAAEYRRLFFITVDEETGNAFLDLAEEILDSGENINNKFVIPPHNNITTTYLNAIHRICSSDSVFHNRIQKLMDTYGGKPTELLLRGEIVFHIVSDPGHFSYLIEKSEKEHVNVDLGFLLNVAFEHQNLKIFEILLEHGADPAGCGITIYKQGKREKITLEQHIFSDLTSFDFYDENIHPKFITLLEQYRGGKSLKAAI